MVLAMSLKLNMLLKDFACDGLLEKECQVSSHLLLDVTLYIDN
jgi:hypothetical protein